MSYYGTVTSFNRITGSGLLQPDQGGDPIEFRKEDFRQPGTAPRQRQRLCYDLATDSTGKPQASNLRFD